MLYIGVDVPMQRLPVTNWALIVVTIFFTGVAWVKQKSAERELEQLIREEEKGGPEQIDPKRFAEMLERAEKAVDTIMMGALQPKNLKPAQFITHAFVHGDFWHLLGNMVFLFAFGNAVNAKIGHWQFILCYFFFAAFAALGYLVLGQGQPMIGASGAIMGIAGMFFVLYPLNELAVHTPHSYMYSGDAWRMPAWIFVVIYMALDLWGTMNKGVGIAYAAHLGGEIGGVVLACGLVVSGYITSDRGERNLPEMWGWVREEAPPPRRRRKPKPKPPRPNVDI